MTKTLLPCLLIAGAVVGAPTRLSAQRSAHLGEVEVAVHGGGTFDLPGAASYVGLFQTTNPSNQAAQFLPGRKSQPLVGGSLAVALHKMLWLYGDYSYMFPDRTAAAISFLGVNGVNTVNRHYWMADGGIQLTFPTVQRVMPYISLGAGRLHQNYSSVRTYSGISTTSANNEFNSFTPHVGAGVRIFVTERSGFNLSADGYYSSKLLEAQVPGIGDTYPTVTRKGFGRVSAGYFVRFGRR
jgi:hypothetical protein